MFTGGLALERGWGRGHPARTLAPLALVALMVLVVLAAPLVGRGGTAFAAAGTPKVSRPNILFILSDDLSTEEMRSMPKVHALLARQGTTFSNSFFNVSLCCPSRTTILRGQYAHNTGVLTNGGANGGFETAHRKGIERSTIATWLQGAGYRTGLFGKYLNGYPNTVPISYVPPGWNDWFSPINGFPYSEFWYTVNENGSFVPYTNKPDDYGTDVYVHKTEDFITQAGKDKVPFFAFVPVYAPHNPAVPAPRHAKLFPKLRAPRTKSFGESDLSDKPKWVRQRRELNKKTIKKVDAIYRQRARSLQALDEGVASLVKTLKANGQLANTYIVFMSDNGYHFGQHSLAVGKGTPYEEDIRVPLIIRGPGVLRDKTRRRLVGNDDLAPTFADLAGVKAPRFVDGRSLVPMLGARIPSDWRRNFLIDHWREVYTSAHPANAARGGALEPSELGGERQSGKGKSDRTPNWHGLRNTRYVYIEYSTGEKELYDLKLDPAELNNISGSASEVLLASLHERLTALRTCRGARCRAIEDERIQTG